jgi:hypothetical protein
LVTVVIHAFGRSCAGWSMRNDLQARLVVDALKAKASHAC